MGKRDGQQKGAQTHAEGQQGAKAHAHFIDSLHDASEAPEASAPDVDTAFAEGGHRLREGREQHDEAEKNSEKNRLG